jgi:hypothetical protein
MTNRLYFGDNLDILRQGYIPDRSVDLIYLDPPFNSQAQYNLLFERLGKSSRSAQAGAFRDTWRWEEEASLAQTEIMRTRGSVARMTEGFVSALGTSNLGPTISVWRGRVYPPNGQPSFNAFVFRGQRTDLRHVWAVQNETVGGARSKARDRGHPQACAASFDAV